MDRSVVFFLIYFGHIAVSIGGQLNTDPAPGRSPGPPGISTVLNDDHGDLYNDPTLILTKDDFDNPEQTTDTEYENNIINDKSNNNNNNKNNNNNNYNNNNKKLKEMQNNGPINQAHDDKKIVNKIDENPDDIDIEINHNYFDTKNNLVCGLVYKIILKHASIYAVADFNVETFNSKNIKKGTFVSNSLRNELPTSWFEPETVSKLLWANDECERNDCLTNNWRGSINQNSSVYTFWMINEYCDTSEEIEFRLSFTVDSNAKNNRKFIFNKKLFKTFIKDCKLHLKYSKGTIDHTILPLYNIDCTIYFPSLVEVSQLQPPSGYLVKLTRFNVPCGNGGYLQFSNNFNKKMCGKLEEFTETDLTYHFDGLIKSNESTSIRIYKNVLFNFNYKLVDYCYNTLLSDKNNSIFINKINNLFECYFKIHLPYGNRINFTLFTFYNDNNNNNNKTNLVENISAANNNNNDYFVNNKTNFFAHTITSTPISLINNNNNSNNINTNNLLVNKLNYKFNELCDGISIKLIEMDLIKWSYCINYDDNIDSSNEATKNKIEKFSFHSSSNILTVHIKNQKQIEQDLNFINTNNQNNYNINSNSNKENNMLSILFKYSYSPIFEIVADCDFGWIYMNQFCIMPIHIPMSWHEAEKLCAKEENGHLLSITADAQQTLLDDMLINSPNYDENYAYWIGGSDKNLEGDFKWTDGLSFTYTKWFPGWSEHNDYNKQPNDDGLSSQDCIEIRKYFRMPSEIQPTSHPFAETFMWNDRDCSAKNYAICEKQIINGNLQQDWLNDCNKTVTLTIEHPKASVWSPSFPHQYPNNANCYITLTAPKNYRIILEFEELVIENEPGCSYDYLEIVEPTKDALKNSMQNNSKFSRHGLRRNTYRKRNSYETSKDKFQVVDENYKNLMSLYSNLYKPRPNYMIETPDFSKDNILLQRKRNNEILPKRMCGDWSSKLKLLRHVSAGPFLGIRFISDYSHTYGGFKATAFMENAAASECPDERLKPFNGSCYLFASYPEVDWKTAQQICKGVGAQLSSISSAAEHKFITTNLRNQMDYTPQIVYWLGGEYKSGQFEWADGTEMIFSGWLPGQGKFDEAPHYLPCLGLQWKMSPTPMLPSGLYWHSESCQKVGGYICKKLNTSFKEIDLRNETITGTEGRLTSPGYPSPYPVNVDYWIRIIAPKHHRIIVQFQKIDLEAQDECLYDFISVQNYDVISHVLLEPGTNIIPMAMLTSELDEINHKNGHYLRRIRRSVTNKFEGFYRSKLKNLSRLKFRNTSKHTKTKQRPLKIKKKRDVDSNSLNSKTKNNFIHNSVLLASKNLQSFLPYVRWCGQHDSNMSKFDFISTSNEIMLNFHSDYSIAGLGFSAIWKSIDTSGCPVQTLTSHEGYLTSLNYPHFLLSNLDCTYVIQAPIGKKILIEFIDYNVIDEAIVFVDVGSGILQPFSNKHHVNEGTFLSLKEHIKIQIKTGQRPRGRGFNTVFKTVGSAIEDRFVYLSNNSNGNIYNLNYPHSTPQNINFSQHLIAPLGEVILLEVHDVIFYENGCDDGNIIEIFDFYADANGTKWLLCKNKNIKKNGDSSTEQAPIFITSYLNTLHVKQISSSDSEFSLNATIIIQQDVNYKLKLASGEDMVESCYPNPCQFEGKCILNGKKKKCQCRNHYTGRFCGLNLCELGPCVFGKCELTLTSFMCRCQQGYIGHLCDQRQKPCADNPCEGRGQCIEKSGGFFCRCHAWWEGKKCEKKILHIPYKPLSERMLQEPFWLGLITVFVVLAFIGLVWCAKRHFPEKIEKLLAEEAERNRPAGTHGHHHTSLREQLQFNTTTSQQPVTASGAPRSIFNRLGIRKPSILSLSSPNPPGGATARTFSLDDLLRPPPRRSPSPRKKRNNSTPVKKNAAEKKQILQQLVSPQSTSAGKAKPNLSDLLQMSENNLKSFGEKAEINETSFSGENSVTKMPRPVSDPKLEKKVTFARLLSKVSAEMSSGSEADANGTKNSSALSLPTDVQYRASSVPPSPNARSPHSMTSQRSESLSSSELALADIIAQNISNFNTSRNNRRVEHKVSSADSILAMFRNFPSTNIGTSSITTYVSPSTTPTDALDDESSSSSMHTPISFSSGPPDSPVFYRQTTIEVPVLDAIGGAHKSSPTASNLLHPPTVLLEIPSNNGINKCLSPIRELPTPMPSPALTPIMPRTNKPNPVPDHFLAAHYSDEEDKNNAKLTVNIIPDFCIDIAPIESSGDSNTTDTTTTTFSKMNMPENKINMMPPNVTIDIDPPTPEQRSPSRPRDLIIPKLIVQQPSPTRSRFPVILVPGSPPPQRASIGETSSMFPNKAQQKKLLKQFEKPTSLDLPFVPPTITITSSTNFTELESDGDLMSPAPKVCQTSLLVPGNPAGMCYLSPFAICTRNDRTISESNLSSSGYSSMASPGPSRCGSNNPLFPNEMDEPGSGHSSNSSISHPGILIRRYGSILASCKEGITNEKSNQPGTSNKPNKDRLPLRSDSETYSDDILIESNDEGIGTDHLEEKIELTDLRKKKELESNNETEKHYINTEETPNMAQLQIPTIVIKDDGSELALSPMSSRSESPLSEKTEISRFSTHFYGQKDQPLPFTDSDGLYDFPSSDGKSAINIHQKRSCSKKRERKYQKNLSTQSPIKQELEVSPKENAKPGLSKYSYYHTHANTNSRKSPKRRSYQKYAIASSSSSSESLTSARELTFRAKCKTSPIHEKNSKGELAQIDNITKAPLPIEKTRSRISRLKAIGNQIRFLRRLEKSIKRKEALVSEVDDDDDDDDNEDCDDGLNIGNVKNFDIPKVTSPLLIHSNLLKHRNSLQRQKRLPINQNFIFSGCDAYGKIEDTNYVSSD